MNLPRLSRSCVVVKHFQFQAQPHLCVPTILSNNNNNKNKVHPTPNYEVRSLSTQHAQRQRQVELTSSRYEVKKGNYGALNDQDVKFFESLLGGQRILTDEADIAGYNVDWMNQSRGASKLVLKPKSTDEVSAILKYCNDRKLAVCPQGGNTGLVGGSVPVFDEIVISTALMNKIISLDELSGVLVCEAGCVLDTLNEYVMEKGFIMPLDLGAKGSCHIGGNVSTNAGGLRLVRYGSLHSTVLGVEAVLANGEIIDCLSLMKKDNTGYDLKHLFIGSEGTLGFVTKVAVQCPVKPNSIKLAFLGLNSFSKVLQTLKAAKQDLSEILSSIEYIDKTALNAVVEKLHLKNPIGEFPFYMLIECSGSNESHDEEKLNTFLEMLMSQEIVSDGTVAVDTSQMLAIWQLRERIAEALMHYGYVYKYDLSVPVTTFDDFVLDMKKQVGQDASNVCGYGHLGDGNIHLNITSKEYTSQLTSKIEPFIYEWTANKKGSVSAEHGMGFRKRNYMSYSKPEGAIKIMKQMKTMLDPNSILNPYKVLPDK